MSRASRDKNLMHIDALIHVVTIWLPSTLLSNIHSFPTHQHGKIRQQEVAFRGYKRR
jgi:hypothetical protein